MSSRPELKLDWCSHEAAKYAVEKWHYSKRIPSTFTKLNKIGVWEDSVFIGAVVFSTGSNKNIGAPYGLKFGGVCELVRVALNRHRTPTSRIISICTKIITKTYPAIRLIVSYAATEEGHVGTLYQAGNWLFVGDVQGGDSFIVNGRKMLNRAADCSGIDKSKHKKVRGHIRHKYLMPLDPAMRAQIEPLRKPYPKRVRSVDGDTPANHAGEGGSTPTRTL
jgi:hypothetical protein